MTVNQEIIAVAYGLASAASWGTSGFSGGFASKKSSVLGVLLVGYITGLVFLSIYALWSGSPIPNLYSLIVGALAGVFGLLGLAAYYKGLASGRMGIVAPLAGVISAAVPVLFGMLLEGFPSSLQVAGFFVAFVAIWLLSASGKSEQTQGRQLGFPVTAGLGFGLSFILYDQAVEQTVLWPLIAGRSASIALLIALLLIFRTGAIPPKHNYPIVCLAGILETAGIIFYALAAQTGRLDISAVLASMYPAGTVILAWMILKERLSLRQWVGVSMTLIALGLIAA